MQLNKMGNENTSDMNIPLLSKYCCFENNLQWNTVMKHSHVIWVSHLILTDNNVKCSLVLVDVLCIYCETTTMANTNPLAYEHTSVGTWVRNITFTVHCTSLLVCLVNYLKKTCFDWQAKNIFDPHNWNIGRNNMIYNSKYVSGCC